MVFQPLFDYGFHTAARAN